MLFLVLLSSCFLFAKSSVSQILPSTYSQYFDKWTPTPSILLSESFFSGEEDQKRFSISLWIKIIDFNTEADIFSIQKPHDQYNLNSFYYFPVLYYTPYRSLALKWTSEYFEDLSMELQIIPSNNWIFLAVSASFELKSAIFYYNGSGSEIYKLENLLSWVDIWHGSAIKIGGRHLALKMRIGDFKFYNSIYNDVLDWGFAYSNSCLGISCIDLFPNICYAQCDQWCKNQAEWFLPLIQPDLFSSIPYYQAQTQKFVNNDDIFYGVNVPTNGWNDYSIAGWVQFPVCHSMITTFFQLIDPLELEILDISLTSNSSSSLCETLEATIYNENASNSTFSSVSLSSLSLIGNWFFLAATVNSGSKILTFYTQNGANYPSSSLPLLSSSITYPYTAIPFSSSINIHIGGNKDWNVYPGNYADFRIYPGNHIDTTLLQYNNNIYSPATYLDSHCMLWSSIWYCQTCENGYFIKNGLCKKCHPSCATCISDDTEISCLSCASRYYAQPEHPSICFNYCPLGYAWDSSRNQCQGTKGIIDNINFDNNLLGDFISSNVYVSFGIGSNYYPNFDFFDPLPANKRGIYLNSGKIVITPQASAQAGRIFSSDLTIQIWVLAQSDGFLYRTSSAETFFIYDRHIYKETSSLTSAFEFEIYSSNLKFGMWSQNMRYVSAISPFDIPFKNPEWALYSLSLSYDDVAKATQVLMARNADYYIETVSGYYKELPKIAHTIGEVSNSIRGFVYSLAIYNYGKIYSEIQLNLGTCSFCSACPKDLNHCLSTCDKTEYVDEDGKCQKCLESCSGTCSRADTCNLCYDDLCYECTKYESGTCIQCVEHANLQNGQCECESEYIKQNSQCVDKCEYEYYLDLNAQLCLNCPENCIKCSNGNTCTICKAGYIVIDGECRCDRGYFIDSSGKCSKCDTLCLECWIDSSKCTSCILDLPILYNSNKCYPCDTFEGYSNYFSVPISYFTDDLFSQLSSHCVEICGDGRNMGQIQCDDGNNINGDGCSSSCNMEKGWTCFGGSVNSPDICKDVTPPSPILAYLSENDSGCTLSLAFSEEVITHDEMSKNIKIEIDGITEFSWAISLKNSIYIIELEIYENVDSGTSVTVYFIKPNSIVDLRGGEMKESYVKTNLVNSFSYKLGKKMETVMSTATTSAVGGTVIGSIFSATILGSYSLQALWGMIEMMQMQYYLIFLSLKYPDNLLSYMNALSISNGSFLPNPFQKCLIKRDPFSDPPERFLKQNYSTDFFMNSGQFLLVWLLILIGLSITLILFRFFPKVTIISWLQKSYLFSILIRLGVESFLEITLSVFLQWREISEPNQYIGYISLIFSFITATYLILTFVLVIWQITLKSEKDLAEKVHERKFGTLYEGFKYNSKLTASFLILQNIRRVLLVIFCVFLYEYTVIQVTLSTVLSFLFTILLIIIRPFKTKMLGNAIQISSEFFYFLAHCIILKLLDDQLSNNDKIRLGWIIIAFLSFSLFLHLFGLLFVQINNLIQGIKHLKEKFMENFANKFYLKRIILRERVLFRRNKEDLANEAYEANENAENLEERKSGNIELEESHEDYFNIDTRDDESFIES